MSGCDSSVNQIVCCGGWRTALVALCTCSVVVLTAQQVAACAESPKPAIAPPTAVPEPEQNHGQTEQVHTGVTSGLDTEARLEALLADHQFLRIEAQLDQMPPEQAQFYRGILANRNNDPRMSIQLLEPLVDSVSSQRQCRARKTAAQSAGRRLPAHRRHGPSGQGLPGPRGTRVHLSPTSRTRSSCRSSSRRCCVQSADDRRAL